MSHQIFNHDLYQVLGQGFVKVVSNCFSMLIKNLVNKSISVRFQTLRAYKLFMHNMYHTQYNVFVK
jgi:hypothetical protein